MIPQSCPRSVIPTRASDRSDRNLQAQQEHDEAKEVFDMLNEQLIQELPQLLDLRVPFFDPSFEAMIRMQCKFAEVGYENLSGVQRYVPSKRSMSLLHFMIYPI